MNEATALLRAASEQLRAAGVPEAMRDARKLLDHALGQAGPHDAVPDAAAARFEALLVRRLARAPMSHILGKRAFWAHEFRVTPDVLDPRPETETLVAAALQNPFARVLDLGTGSGAILLSLLAARPQASGVGTDLSPAALQVAAGNAADLGVTDRATFLRSDWLAQVRGTFDLILSNPPYIAQSEMPGLAPELAHEPRMALTDEADGLTAYRSIARTAGAHLAPGGHLLLEIGPTQARDVSALLVEAGWRDVSVLPDLDGRDRVVQAHGPVDAPG